MAMGGAIEGVFELLRPWMKREKSVPGQGQRWSRTCRIQTTLTMEQAPPWPRRMMQTGIVAMAKMAKTGLWPTDACDDVYWEAGISRKLCAANCLFDSSTAVPIVVLVVPPHQSASFDLLFFLFRNSSRIIDDNTQITHHNNHVDVSAGDPTSSLTGNE